MTASVLLDSYDFLTETGSVPLWRISGKFERETTGALGRYVWNITLSGAIIATGGTLAARQDSLNERKLALITQLELGNMVLTILDEDGSTVSLQIGGVDPTGANPNATWKETEENAGVWVDDFEFPDQANETLHESWQDYTIPLRAYVEIDCSDDVIGCHWNEEKVFQNSVLQSITYTGWVYTCPGVDCADEVDALIVDLRAMALAQFQADAAFVRETDRRQGKMKDNDTRCTFSVTFGTGGDSSGTSADDLQVSASLQIVGNHITLNVTGTYTYSSSQRRTVLEEARVLQGINTEDYLPSAGTRIIHTETQMAFNDPANQVSCTQKIICRWNRNTDILRVTDNIRIERSFPSVSEVLHGWLPGDSVPPAASLHVGGAGAVRISITTSVESTSQWSEFRPRFVNDYFNGPIQVRGSGAGADGLTTDVEGDLTDEGLYKASSTQVWLHADPTSLPVPIPLASLLRALTGGPAAIPEFN